MFKCACLPLIFDYLRRFVCVRTLAACKEAITRGFKEDVSSVLPLVDEVHKGYPPRSVAFAAITACVEKDGAVFSSFVSDVSPDKTIAVLGSSVPHLDKLWYVLIICEQLLVNLWEFMGN